MQFHTGEDYVLGNVGYLCSDKWFPPITEIKNCNRSFHAMKIMYPGLKNKVGLAVHGLGGRPKGCFLHISKNSLYWNPDEKGIPNLDSRQICDSKSK